MDTRFYVVADQQINIESLANTIVHTYQTQGYQAQAIGNKDHLLIQLRKGSNIEAFVGLQASLTLSLQRSSGGVVVTVGQQKWIDKAAVGVVGLVFSAALWPLALTAGAGAIRQANLRGQVLAMIDALVRQQYPDVLINPVLSGANQG